MSWVPSVSSESRYSDWDVRSEGDWHYLGTVPQDEAPMLYNRGTGNVHRGRVDKDAEQFIPDKTPSWSLSPGDTLGQFLERIGKDLGWESLSEFARDHLEDDQNQ